MPRDGVLAEHQPPGDVEPKIQVHQAGPHTVVLRQGKSVSYGVPFWRPVGTCRMGRSADAVMSPRLAVHGLEHLYLAGASAMPAITRGTMQAPAITIAEKAASLLAG